MNTPTSARRAWAARAAASTLALALAAAPIQASSHMDAPLITLDRAANTTDVYAFVSTAGETKYLTTAVSVYPFEDPGIGPNRYNFDDNVQYTIHVATGDDVAKGKPTFSYEFRFQTEVKNPATILESFDGVISSVGGPGQNLVQSYSVTRVDRSKKKPKRTQLGTGIVPPNNQGRVTPLYNQGDDGENPARPGVATSGSLDSYTAQSIATLDDGYLSFAGQRDDGFYADIQAVFDLLALRGTAAKDSQKGFNVHTIVLNIPVDAIGGDMQQVGVFATTARRKVTVRRAGKNDKHKGGFVQVGRQGNPLFCEGFVAVEDKDRYNQTLPTADAKLFSKYALEPELARLINAVLFNGVETAIETNRTDIAGIFIPDVIKVDLSTGPARLAGGGPSDSTNPDDAGFSSLSIFGGDVLTSQIQEGLFGDGTIPGGWPNGRRFGDDVLDIAVSAALSDLRDPDNLVINPAPGIDGVDANDIAYNKVFPYAATPLNGRNHLHD